MILRSEREQIVEACDRLIPDGLVVGTAGNLSIRSGDLLAITPSGLPYADLRPDLVCVVELATGAVVDGPLKPASELGLHLVALQETGAQAVVHTHSTAATAVASLEDLDVLPSVHYYVAVLGGPVRVAGYARYGSPELAANVRAALAGRTGALMRNHGAVVVGDDLASAYDKAVQLEWVCDVYLRARAAGPVAVLPDDEIAGVVGQLASYGQTRPR